MNDPTRGDYRTPVQPVGRLRRAFPGVVFYAGAASVVLGASRTARRGAYTDQRWIEDSLKVLKLLESVGVTLTVENTAAFRELDSPCVFIANHMSTLETFVLPCIIRPHRKVTFIVKDTLVRAPAFRHVMISRDPIIVSRVNPRRDLKAVLDGGLDRLARGVSLIVFPQTTRTTSFDESSFNSIGVKLARRAGVPVVPLALKTDAWGIGGLVRDLGSIRPDREVRFSFGDPLAADDGQQAHRQVVAFIGRHLSSWRGKEEEREKARRRPD